MTTKRAKPFAFSVSTKTVLSIVLLSLFGLSSSVQAQTTTNAGGRDASPKPPVEYSVQPYTPGFQPVVRSGNSFVTVGFAEPSIDVDYLSRQNVDERLKSDGPGLLGDSIDLNTGSLSFEHVDISLPGNSALEVAVRRTRSMGRADRSTATASVGDWLLEVPRVSIILHGQADTNADPARGADLCFTGRLGPIVVRLPGQSQPGIDPSAFNIIEDYEYSNGMNLEIPAKGSSKLLDAPQGITWPSGTIKVTSDYWALRCTDSGASFGGLIATAPNGDVYTFDYYIERDALELPVGTAVLFRHYAILLATKVTDVNGNWVDYSYDTSGKLTKISSNDGRQITLVYGAGDRLASATANTATSTTTDDRTWSYTYTTFQGWTSLSGVTLPDGRQWSFNLSAMNGGANPQDGCTALDLTVSLTHPNGATGTFLLHETRHLKGYSGIYSSDTFNCITLESNYVPYFDAMSVKTKTLSGSGYPSSIWNYTYAGYISGAIPSTKWGQVVGPLGRKTKSTYHRATDLEGLVLKTENFATSGASTPMQTTNFTYTVEGALGTSWMDNENTGKFTKPRNQATHVVTGDGDTFTTNLTYNTTQSSSSYSYSSPIKIKRWSNVSTTQRITDLTYINKTTPWVLALPNLMTINGRNTAQFGYDSLGRKIWINQYGVRVADFTYHTNVAYKGALLSIKDALNRTNYYYTYKGGQPTQFTRPDGVSEYQSIDVNGWITSSTDARGFTTSYTRDAMGRVTRITPSKTQASWNDTVISYAFGGGITQTITNGNGRTTVTYDALTRPFLERTQDLASGYSHYVKTAYNALGEVTFSSFPSTSSNPTTGSTSTYDGLGRVKTVSENVSPFATTSTNYLSTHRRQVIDPSGQSTTYYSDGYGGPGKGDLLRINQPLGTNTYLNRNIWGQMTQLRQTGTLNGFAVDQSQFFYFDTRQRLCRHHTPEGGDTLMAYDAASQLTASARGMGGGTACTTPSGSSLVTTSYDLVGRPTVTDFADAATPDISRTFDANGNPTIVARNNVNWFYFYNELNLLTAEIFQMDGLSFNSGYGYNLAGQMTTRTFPSNLGVVITRDGLGRETQIASSTQVYATGLSYHPNGALSAMSYGNGQVFSQTLNARQLPLRLRSVKGSNLALDLTYAYDSRAKITSITDAAVPGQSRSFGYNALGQLSTASGVWGSGSFSFDALSNLRTKSLGARNITVTYDANNRAISNTDTGPLGNRNIYYDARGNVTTLGGLGFVYDYSDQPVSVSGAATGTYTYDGNRKRVKSVVGGITRYNVYDASGKLIHTRNGGVQTDYIRAGGMTVARKVGSTITYLHPDHLGSAETGTDSVGDIAWRETHTPFGEVINPAAANDNEAAYTGHIRDSATGLNYMQARYQDPVIGRFLSIDPVGFTPDQPFMFGRYTYVGNDPVNGGDPFGERSDLISRPIGILNFNHMFVVVTDDKTGKLVARFSYGPQRENKFSPGKLVSLTGTDLGTNRDDHNAYLAFSADPEAARKDGISAVRINASDAAVLAYGKAVNQILGTPAKPGNINYSALTGPYSSPDNANSNSASFAVTKGAVQSENPNATQSLPPGTNNPGYGQSGRIQVTGVIRVTGRVESRNLSECGELKCE